MKLIDSLNYFRLALAGIAILLLLCSPIFLYFKIKRTQYKRLGNYGLWSSLIIGFSILPINLAIEELCFQELKKHLNYSKDNDVKILVNQVKPEFDYDELFEKIRNKDFFSHRDHSHNTNEFQIDIIENEQVYSFSLFRDSRELQKYWIYNNNHNYELEIGNIETDLLDKY